MFIIPCITINGERFAGLNIRGFSPMKFFTGIFSRCLGQRFYYLTIVKYSWENFHGTLKNHENHERKPSEFFYVYGS